MAFRPWKAWPEAAWAVVGGRRAAPGARWAIWVARWAPFGSQGGSEAEFERLLGALGAVLVALGPLRGPSGALLGHPGELLERILASRGGLFRACWAFFVGTPCVITKTCKFADSTALFAVFHGPEGSKIAPKRPEDQSFSQEIDLDGQEVALDGQKIDLDGQKVGLDSQKAARRAQQTGRNSTELAEIKSPHVKRTSICSNMD